MGILSSIGHKFHQVKERTLIATKLCGRSWRLITNDDSVTTYVFKSDGTLLITRDGFLSPSTWDYRSENDTLIIIDANGGGLAFHVNFLEDGDLITLVIPNSSDGIFLTNEKSTTAPKNFAQVEELFINTRVNLIKGAAEQLPPIDIKLYRDHTDNFTIKLLKEAPDSIINRNTPEFRNYIDSVLDGVQSDMLVKIIDRVRTQCPSIDREIKDIEDFWEERVRKEKEMRERAEAKREYEELTAQGIDDIRTTIALLGAFSPEEILPKKEKSIDFLLRPRLSDYSSKLNEYVQYKNGYK